MILYINFFFEKTKKKLNCILQKKKECYFSDHIFVRDNRSSNLTAIVLVWVMSV